MAEPKKQNPIIGFFTPRKLNFWTILKWVAILWVVFKFLLPAVGGLKGAKRWTNRLQGALESILGPEAGTPPGVPGVVVDEGALVNYQNPVAGFDPAGNISSLTFKGLRGKILADYPESEGWVISPSLRKQPGTSLAGDGQNIQLRFQPALDVEKGTWLQGQVRVKSGRTTQTLTWTFQVPGKDTPPAVGPASGGKTTLPPREGEKEEPQAPPKTSNPLREAGERWINRNR